MVSNCISAKSVFTLSLNAKRDNIQNYKSSSHSLSFQQWIIVQLEKNKYNASREGEEKKSINSTFKSAHSYFPLFCGINSVQGRYEVYWPKGFLI